MMIHPFSPQNLIGFLVFIIGVYCLIQAWQERYPAQPNVEILVAQTPVGSHEKVWIGVCNPMPHTKTGVTREPCVLGLGSQEVVLELPTGENHRIEAILARLKKTISETALCGASAKESVCQVRLRTRGYWPDTLPVPQVFISDYGSGARAAVLNFGLTEPVQIDIHHEKVLLASIRTTLAQNSIDTVDIMINDTLTPTFLGHIALPEMLGEVAGP